MYVALITYNWDTDYVSKSFYSEEEAIEFMNKLLDEEVELVKKENEYEPKVIRHQDNYVELIYEEEQYIDSDSNSDIATYRVIKANTIV